MCVAQQKASSGKDLGSCDVNLLQICSFEQYTGRGRGLNAPVKKFGL